MAEVTYSNYLKLDQLLTAQEPLSQPIQHDEYLFIAIHQVYELWFKQVLLELEFLKRAFTENDTPKAFHTLNRVLKIFKTLVSQVDILETMTPLSFASFRERLETASGFQSVQFRELEILLGARRPNESAPKLIEKTKQPTLYDYFLNYLKANGQDVPLDVLKRSFATPYLGDARVQKLLISLYQAQSPLSWVSERLLDLDEGLQEWRYRHVKMVERTIGVGRGGTGGSSGSEYLKGTLFKPVFPDLWAIRSEFFA